MKPIPTTWAIVVVAALLALGGTISTALVVSEQHQRLEFEREKAKRVADLEDEEARDHITANLQRKVDEFAANATRRAELVAALDRMKQEAERRQANEAMNQKIDSLVGH